MMKVELNTANTLASNGQVTQQISLNLDFLTLLLGILGKGENLSTTEQNWIENLEQNLNNLENTDGFESFKQLFEKIKKQAKEIDSDNLDIVNFLTHQLSININQNGTIASDQKEKSNNLQINKSRSNEAKTLASDIKANLNTIKSQSQIDKTNEELLNSIENKNETINNHSKETYLLEDFKDKNSLKNIKIEKRKNDGQLMSHLKDMSHLKNENSQTKNDSKREISTKLTKEENQNIISHTDKLKKVKHNMHNIHNIKKETTINKKENQTKPNIQNEQQEYNNENRAIYTIKKESKEIEKEKNNLQETTLTKTENTKKESNIDLKTKEGFKIIKDDKTEDIHKKEHNIYISEAKNNLKIQNIKQSELHLNIQKTNDIRPQEVPHFVKDLIFHINQEGKHHVKIKLNPPNLGEVKISMSIDKGEVKLIFTVENSQAAQAIHQQINNLNRAILDCGLQLSSCHINLGQNSEEHKRNEHQNRENKKIAKIENNSKENFRTNYHQGLINITI